MACPSAEETRRKTAGCGFPESIVHLLRNRIARAWSASFADQALISAVNFATGVMIGRSCSKDEFGLYMLGFSAVLLVTDIQISLVSTPYMVYSPRMDGRRLRLYAGSTLVHELALSAVVMAALALGAVSLAAGFGPPGLGRVIRALAATIVFIMFREFVRRISFAHLRVRAALILDVCIAVLQVAGLLALHRAGALSAARVYWVIGGACAVAGTGWLLLNRKAFEPHRVQAVSDLRHNWRFGKWVFASALLWTVSTNLYPWLLTSFHGTASAGTWGACMGVIALANVPFVGIQNSLGPQIAGVRAREGAAALRRFTFRSALLLSVVMGVLCCVLLAVGEPLLVLLYGGKYAGNGPVVSVAALSLLASTATFCYSRALFAMERADLDFMINLIPLFVLFTAGLWLVRAFGPLGAALGLLAANAASTCARLASFFVLMRPYGSREAS